MERDTEEYDVVSGGKNNPRGTLTARDRELLALIALARHLSTDQVNQLLRPGRHESGGRRRLFALAGVASRRRRPGGAPGRPVFSPPYLRRRSFRSTRGDRVDVWALTPQGYALASQVLGAQRRFNREDVGDAFLEHSLALTDLFVSLAAPYMASGVGAAALPFRWDPTDSKHLPWEEYDANADKRRARRIVPDAILELSDARRRYFIECEMGTHSIAAASDEKAGATLAKTERYDEFLAGGFYARSFPDRWPAEVLYLVRSESRRHNVTLALERWARERATVSVRARAVTHAQAETELRALLPAPPRAAPTAAASHRAPPLAQGDVELLKRFYQESLRHLITAQKALHRATEPEYLTLASQVRSVLIRLSGTSRRANSAEVRQ